MTATKDALLVIDLQQGLFRKSTPVYKAEALLDAIQVLVERAHNEGALVVYIQHSSGKVLPFGSADWQLHPRLQPQDGDLIVHKLHGNSFEDTPLQGELAARGIGRAVLTGLVTHGCVKATCLGALELGYEVIVVEDGHSSYSKDAAGLIAEWNGKLAESGASVSPACSIEFSTRVPSPPPH